MFLWVFVPLICAFVWFDAWFFRPLFYSRIVQWLAVVIAIVSFVITWICWRNMGKSWRMGINPEEKTELVFSGPFAYVRNPIYGLSQVLMLCAILVAQRFDAPRHLSAFAWMPIPPGRRPRPWTGYAW